MLCLCTEYNEDCSSCEVADICVADNPCTSGVCELVFSPNQYACNCTGTNYMGTNCSGIESILTTSFCDILFHGRM